MSNELKIQIIVHIDPAVVFIYFANQLRYEYH